MSLRLFGNKLHPLNMIILQDNFPGSSVDTSKWIVVNTVTVANGEATLQKTDNTGTVGGSLRSQALIPHNFVLQWKDRFITNIALQSGSGFWYNPGVFVRMSSPDWTQGDNYQMFLTYHADTNQVVEVFLYITRRAGSSSTSLGRIQIPLNLLDSLDIEGTGAIANLSVDINHGDFAISAGGTFVCTLTDASPLLHKGPIQFNDNEGINLTAIEAISEVLITH